MLYRVLADTVVLIHFLWIIFVIAGAIPGTRYRAVKVIHIPSLAFALIIQIFGWYCPLTLLEVWLRSKHDPALAYPGSFIIHYAEKIVYIELSRSLILVLTVFLCGFNVWFYLRGMQRGKKSRPPFTSVGIS